MIRGYGVDVVEIDRIASLLARHEDRFVSRCFTASEAAYAAAGGARRVERLAVRFAAKEAVFKALGTGWRSGLAWTEIEVTRDALGKPGLRLSGACAERAVAIGVRAWHLSLSHTRRIAYAGAIGEGEPA